MIFIIHINLVIIYLIQSNSKCVNDTTENVFIICQYDITLKLQKYVTIA